MPITAKFKTVPIADITINRDIRQRRELKDIDSLAESIRVNGLIHPPLVEKQGNTLILIAGERRLTACKSLGWDDIPVQFAKDLTEEDSQALELEENVRRSNLTWSVIRSGEDKPLNLTDKPIIEEHEKIFSDN